MKRNRKTLVFLLIVAVVIQLIQPTRNISALSGDNDISKVYQIPAEVYDTFTSKCYDCHSNNTRYPWYFNVQPIGWWLAAHVHDGKEHLNFSEFRTYDAEKSDHTLGEILEVIDERSMPLKAYILLNPHSEITPGDERAIRAWISEIRADNN